MPRHKSFDPDASLDAAMHQFWRHGFAQTSVGDLVHCTGLNRSSLYATFESKDALFEQALHRYDASVRRQELTRLAREHTPIGAIEALFDGWIHRAVVDEDDRGCLLVNTATELGTSEGEAARQVARTQQDTEAWFRERLLDAQSRGEVAAQLNCDDAARSLLAALLGMLVLIRTRPEKSLLESIARTALQAIGAAAQR